MVENLEKKTEKVSIIKGIGEKINAYCNKFCLYLIDGKPIKTSTSPKNTLIYTRFD
jgi:hypothetical protein